MRDSSLTLDYLTSREGEFPPDIQAQIDAALKPSSSAPTKPAPAEQFRAQERAVLDRMRQHSSSTPVEQVQEPTPGEQTPVEQVQEPTPGEFSTNHPIFGALLLSASVYGKPVVAATDQGRRIAVTLESGLKLIVDLRLWTMCYQTRSKSGPTRLMKSLTPEESGILQKLVDHHIELEGKP